MCVCVCVSVCVCEAKPVVVELRCHATALFKKRASENGTMTVVLQCKLMLKMTIGSENCF